MIKKIAILGLLIVLLVACGDDKEKTESASDDDIDTQVQATLTAVAQSTEVAARVNTTLTAEAVNGMSSADKTPDSSDNADDEQEVNTIEHGFRILLEADIAIENLDESSMDATRKIIERRVNGLGIAEATVQQIGNNRLLVELPEITDREMVLNTIQGTGLLEFVDFSGLGAGMPPAGSCILTTAQLELHPDVLLEKRTCPPLEPGGEPRMAQTNNGQPYVTVMTGQGLSDAVAAPRQNSTSWLVNFTLSDEGSEIFADFTGSHIGQPLAIVLDGEVISAPTIQDRISGSGQITGNFKQAEAEALAIQLRYGALPVPLKVISVDSF